MLSDQIEELAKKHGATSYRNRADTQHPAYGFTPAQLVNLLADFTAEVRKDDEALIRQMLEALETCGDGDGYNGPYQYYETVPVEEAVVAARARLEKAP